MPSVPFQNARELPFALRLAHSAMAELCDYWIRLGGDTRVPAYRDFDPLAVPRHLPYLQILRRDAVGRYRIGLSGDHVIELMGRDNTGKFLNDLLPPDRYAKRAVLFDATLRTGLPIAFRAFLATPGREHRQYKRLLLPFVENGPAPDLILSMTVAVAVGADGRAIAEAGADGIAETLFATRADLRASSHA